jgi:7-cyano-7-deazaguanine reductase
MPQSCRFSGVDVWHAYELGFLTQTGLPVTGLLKIVYPANSEFLVESKSLKLYLNSFNMERFGHTPAQGVQLVLNTIEKDLSPLLKTTLSLNFFHRDTPAPPFDFGKYEILETLDGMESITFTAFHEDPALLASDQSKAFELNVGTHLLRSNCKITHQPDWGSAYIHMKGEKLPAQAGLLQYLVSIRNENHFHEEICEMIYQRLWVTFAPDALMVACIYTRRGGIDICPVRASHATLYPKFLVNPQSLSAKLLRQ